MSKVILELEDDWKRRLTERAVSESRSEEELLRDAVREYLGIVDTNGHESNTDPYDPLRRMIGLTSQGPSDASIHHDLRPTDDR
jgi:hypothetical protein